MFFVFVAIILIFILLWGGMVWLRKSLWDVVHRNLLDMEDLYDGTVIRDGFASRPVFHGKVKGKSITINFSSSRAGNKRQNYIDISITTDISTTLTIAEANWLQDQATEGQAPNKSTIETKKGIIYYFMPASNGQVKKLAGEKSFIEILNNFDNLAYIFVGKTGTICEFYTETLDKDTEIEIMTERLEQIDKLLQKLKTIK